MDVVTIVLVLVLVVVGIVIWPLTLGRRYFMGERRGWPQIRRDLYGGSLDEGMYPLDPREDDQRDTRDPDG